MNKQFSINDMYNQQIYHRQQQQALNLAQQSISLANAIGQNIPLGGYGQNGYGNQGWGVTQAEQDVIDHHWLIEHYQNWCSDNSQLPEDEFNTLHYLTWGRNK